MIDMRSKNRRLACGTAKRLVDGVIRRCDEVNASGEFIESVARAWLFGSCARGEQRPHDVDICLQLDRRPHGVCGQEWVQTSIRFAEESGREFRSFIDMIYWPTTSLLRKVRGGSVALSIHIYHDTEKVVYDHPETTMIYECENLKEIVADPLGKPFTGVWQ